MKSSGRFTLIMTGALSLLSLIVLVVLFILFAARGGEKGINRDRANVIIQAVYQYEKDSGNFPVRLEDLVPDYLERVPRTLTRKEFLYHANAVDGFFIVFEIYKDGLHYGCGYSDQAKVWECGGGD